MIRKLITLFKLGRKIARSDILSIASKFKKPPLALIILFKILSFSFQKKAEHDLDKDEGQRLSRSLESMGTTFIKLGQFLATRPDIIGEELSQKLENLQDRLPPFSHTPPRRGNDDGQALARRRRRLGPNGIRRKTSKGPEQARPGDEN